NLLAQMVLRKWESMSPPSLIENPFHIETDFFYAKVRRVPLVEPPPSLKKRLIQNESDFFCF
ncbi:hypothetical protein ACI76Q_07260, partial [Capnocytophaga canimorsus]|uniref:hypothetical protein n=1 Tax=Capnocytophaga canimorsus TaxID=28188 RepID=UPI00385BE334